jgi:hypothetical protein
MMSRTACRSVVPSRRTWRALGYAALHARHIGPTAGDKGTTDDYHRDRTQKMLVAHPEAGLPAETRQQDALQGRAQAAQYVDAEERDADAHSRRRGYRQCRRFQHVVQSKLLRLPLRT